MSRVHGHLNGVFFWWEDSDNTATFSLADSKLTCVLSMDIHGLSATIEYLGQGTDSGECWHGAGHYMIPLGLWRQPEIDYWYAWVAYDEECADGKDPDRPVEPEGIEYWPYKD